MPKKPKKRKRLEEWVMLAIAGPDVFFSSRDGRIARVPLAICLGLRDRRALDLTLEEDGEAGKVRFVRAGKDVAAIPKDLAAVLTGLLEDWDGSV